MMTKQKALDNVASEFSQMIDEKGVVTLNEYCELLGLGSNYFADGDQYGYVEKKEE